ncbi:hypothetical protein AOLI_G00015490 [Acnodon oligacanthus]
MLVRRMKKRQKASEEARDGGGEGALGHRLGDFDLTRGQEDRGADVERDEKKEDLNCDSCLAQDGKNEKTVAEFLKTD